MVERQLRGAGSPTSGCWRRWRRCRARPSCRRALRHRAYADSALPIGAGQTISQPWIVAAICQALELRGAERVLEVGTGSGYSACVLALLARRGDQRRAPRGARPRGAREALAALGVANVELIVGDGSRGLPERAPFEAIAVHAAAPAPPPALLAQLAEGGRLVVPIAGRRRRRSLTLLRRRGDEVETETIAPCRFVPLIGEEGF